MGDRENATTARFGAFDGVLSVGAGSRADHRPQSDRREEPGVGLGEAEPLTLNRSVSLCEWGQDKGRSPPGLPPEPHGGECGRAEGGALCPSPQGAEQVASARSGARCRRSGAAVCYENRLRIVSYSCIISYQYEIQQYDTKGERRHGTSRHYSGSSFHRR